jgi:hypothetical protein
MDVTGPNCVGGLPQNRVRAQALFLFGEQRVDELRLSRQPGGHALAYAAWLRKRGR